MSFEYRSDGTLVVPVSVPLWQVLAGTLLFLGMGGFFVYAGMTNTGEELEILGHTVLDSQGLVLAFHLVGALFLICFAWALAGIVRRLRGQQRIEIDANRIVLYGLTFTGAERTLDLRDVTGLITLNLRGIPVLELRSRVGEKMEIASVLFDEMEDFDRIRDELTGRLARAGVKV